MTKFKKGDRVLVEGFVQERANDFTYVVDCRDQDGIGRVNNAYESRIHPMPPVPIPDLLEELEELWAWLHTHMPSVILKTRYDDEHLQNAMDFQRTREAAQKPNAMMWLKVEAADEPDDPVLGVCVKVKGTTRSHHPPKPEWQVYVHPDDIVTEKP